MAGQRANYSQLRCICLSELKVHFKYMVLSFTGIEGSSETSSYFTGGSLVHVADLMSMWRISSPCCGSCVHVADLQSMLRILCPCCGSLVHVADFQSTLRILCPCCGSYVHVADLMSMLRIFSPCCGSLIYVVHAIRLYGQRTQQCLFAPQLRGPRLQGSNSLQGYLSRNQYLLISTAKYMEYLKCVAIECVVVHNNQV